MRDAAKHLAMHRIDPATKSYLVLDVNHAEVGKPCLMWWAQGPPEGPGVYFTVSHPQNSGSAFKWSIWKQRNPLSSEGERSNLRIPRQAKSGLCLE